MRRTLLAGLAASGLLGLSRPALAATFVPPGGDWQTLETRHFRIHYPVELEAIARKAAVYAENAQERMGPYFDRPDDVSDITILDTLDTTNGFGTSFPETRLTFFATPPSPDEEWYVGRYDNWLKLIISHEYSHLLQARATAGPLEIPGLLNAMIIRAVVPDFSSLFALDFLPPFLKEGMAVYQESLFTGGGRALEGQFDMALREQFMANKTVPIDQAAGYYSLNWALGGDEYLYGVSFYEYLATHYGDESVAQLTKNLGQFPWGGINLAAMRTYGKSIYSLWDDAMAYYRKRYERQVAEIRQLPITPLQAITHTGRNHRHPKWLDNDTLLYNRWPLTGATGLVERKLDGSPATFLFGKRSDTDYTLTNDRKSLYFYDDGDSPPECEFHDIFRYDVKTQEVKQITHGMRAAFPCPSPDGTQILVAINGGGRNDLGMIDDTGRLLWRIHEPLFSSLGNPVWSPDGKKIALSHWIDGHTNIVVFDPKTRTLTTPAPDDAVQVFPTWSADSQTLLFASDRTGVMNIHAVRLTDGKRFQVTNVLGGAVDPSVSPDGTRIALADYGPDGYDIKILPYDPATWIPQSAEPTANAYGHPQGGDLAILPPNQAPSGSPAVLTRAAQQSGQPATVTAAIDPKLSNLELIPPEIGPQGRPVPALLRELEVKDVKYLPSDDPLHDPVLEAAANAPSYPYNPLESLAPQLIYPRLVVDTSVYPGFSFPGLAGDLNGGGALVAVQTYAQDALRQHTYFATVGLETAIRRPLVSFSYLNDMWAPTLGVGLSYSPSLTPWVNSLGDLIGRDSRSLTVSATYPTIESPLLSSWLTGTTFTLGASFQNFAQTLYDKDGNPISLPAKLQSFHAPLVPGAAELPNEVNTLSLTVQSNSATRPSRPISDVGGPLWAAGVERAEPILGSEASYTKAWGDVRYFLPTFGRQVLALRAFGGTSFSDTRIDNSNGSLVIQPVGWVLGDFLATSSAAVSYGMATGVAIHDYDDIRGLPSDLSPILPVRGYSLGVPVPGQPAAPGFGSGAHAAVLSAEYRLPILDVTRGLGTFPLFLDRIELAPFVDMAKAWTVWNQSIPLVGVGAEVRFHIEVVQQIPTEIRLGYAKGLTDNLGTNQIIFGVGAAF